MTHFITVLQDYDETIKTQGDSAGACSYLVWNSAKAPGSVVPEILKNVLENAAKAGDVVEHDWNHARLRDAIRRGYYHNGEHLLDVASAVLNISEFRNRALQEVLDVLMVGAVGDVVLFFNPYDSVVSVEKVTHNWDGSWSYTDRTQTEVVVSGPLTTTGVEGVLTLLTNGTYNYVLE